MSHFSVLVMLPSAADNIEKAVGDALAPFDENKKVESYLKECWCKNSIASRDAFNYAEQHATMKLDAYRNAYWGIKGNKPNWEDFISDWRVIREQAEKSHPFYQHFDSDCEDCGGTGSRESTYNPLSKWDWWQIGGRWTGSLVDNYDPAKDLQNQEWCDVCGGTGNRTDFEYYADPSDIANTRYCITGNPAAAALFGNVRLADAQAIKPGYVKVEWCNGCDGKGLRVAWPTKWKQFEGDIQRVRDISLKFQPFAMVTPDGKWLERGEMGWFGMTRNEKGGDEWTKTVEESFEAYLDCIGVLVDCHI